MCREDTQQDYCTLGTHWVAGTAEQGFVPCKTFQRSEKFPGWLKCVVPQCDHLILGYRTKRNRVQCNACLEKHKKGLLDQPKDDGERHCKFVLDY